MFNCIRCHKWLDPEQFLSRSGQKYYKACARCRLTRTVAENKRLEKQRQGIAPARQKSTPPPLMHHPADEVLGGDSALLFALRRPLIEMSNDENA